MEIFKILTFVDSLYISDRTTADLKQAFLALLKGTKKLNLLISK